MRDESKDMERRLFQVSERLDRSSRDLQALVDALRKEFIERQLIPKEPDDE